jgi:hypothetical protein
VVDVTAPGTARPCQQGARFAAGPAGAAGSFREARWRQLELGTADAHLRQQQRQHQDPVLPTNAYLHLLPISFCTEKSEPLIHSDLACGTSSNTSTRESDPHTATEGSLHRVKTP